MLEKIIINLLILSLMAMTLVCIFIWHSPLMSITMTLVTAIGFFNLNYEHNEKK